MLVVSADGGWRNYCHQSTWFVYERELGAAMAQFQQVPGVVCAAFAKQVNDGKVEFLNSAIERELISFVEGMAVYAEVSAAFHYDPQMNEMNYLGFEFRDGPSFKLVDHDKAERIFVFESVVDVNISASCSFSFQVRDEGDYISIGGAYVTTKTTQKMSLAITICGDPTAEFDVVEIEVIDYEDSVDFGYVEPDYGGEHDED